MEHLLFIVDEKLPEELRPAVEKACRDAHTIYQIPSWITNLRREKGIEASDFINSAKFTRRTEYGRQKDAKQILKAANERLECNGRHIVFVTASDITSPNKERESGYLNFCFDSKSDGNAIVSMARFMDLSAKTQKTVLTGLIMQSIGYIFGVAGDPKRVSTEDNLGMHCTNKFCVMQQGLTKNKMVGVMRRAAIASKLPWRAKPHGAYYCPHCARDIKSTLLI